MKTTGKRAWPGASGLEYLGLKVDPAKNAVRGGEVEISADDSAVKAFVIATNEELAIARETARLLAK